MALMICFALKKKLNGSCMKDVCQSNAKAIRVVCCHFYLLYLYRLYLV